MAPLASLPMKKHCRGERGRPNLISGACVMDIVVALLVGLLWGLALAGLLKVWTLEAFLASWIDEKEHDEKR